MEDNYQQLFIQAELELQADSLEPTSENLKEAYKEFAELYPTLNELARQTEIEAVELQDQLDRKRADSLARAGAYSLVGLIASLFTANVVGIVASSACVYLWFLTPTRK